MCNDPGKMPVEPKSLANLCWMCCVNLNSEFPFTSACAGLPSPNSCGSMWVVFVASIPAWPRETETSYTIPDIVSRLQAQACKVLTHWVLCECASIPVAKRDGNTQTDSRFCLAAVPKVLTHVFHTWNPQNPLSKIKNIHCMGFIPNYFQTWNQCVCNFYQIFSLPGFKNAFLCD